jgi:hypothetical protein
MLRKLFLSVAEITMLILAYFAASNVHLSAYFYLFCYDECYN